MKNITIVTFFSRGFYIAATFILVDNESSLLEPLLVLTLSNLIGVIVSNYLIFIKYRFFFIMPDVRYISCVLNSAKYFALSRLSVSSYSYLNNIIVGLVLGPGASALFTSCEKLYSAGQSITSPIANVLYPYLNRTKDKAFFYKVIIFFLVPILLGVSISFYYSREILILFFGREFGEGSDILKVFLVVSIINFLSVNYGYPAFAIKSRVDIANKSVILGAVIQFTLLLFLYIFDLFSAANLVISVLIVELLVLSYRLIYYFKVLN